MPPTAIAIEIDAPDYVGEIVRADRLLNAGSLLMHSPGHPNGQLGVTITEKPAWGASIPNIAWREAAAMIGAGSAESLSSKLVNSGFVDGTDGRYGRTLKGALEVIVSKVNDSASHYFSLNMAAAIAAYIKANPQHRFYMSLSGRVTRAGGAAHIYQRLSAIASGSPVRSSFLENSSGVIQSAPRHLRLAGARQDRESAGSGRVLHGHRHQRQPRRVARR
ncbi:hypothetical protein HR12_20900 [Microbacterium sp. SUBG005]|nr:hypothetical protein HR12_20900 [Microbacterium sp. SUBG005]